MRVQTSLLLLAGCGAVQTSSGQVEAPPDASAVVGCIVQTWERLLGADLPAPPDVLWFDGPLEGGEAAGAFLPDAYEIHLGITPGTAAADVYAVPHEFLHWALYSLKIQDVPLHTAPAWSQVDDTWELRDECLTMSGVE